MNFTLGCITHTIAILLGYSLGVVVTANIMRPVLREENRELLEDLYKK